MISKIIYQSRILWIMRHDGHCSVARFLWQNQYVTGVSSAVNHLINPLFFSLGVYLLMSISVPCITIPDNFVTVQNSGQKAHFNRPPRRRS
nr:MAG TPA: hypothetical protein [Caudoviricetes sp.]